MTCIARAGKCNDKGDCEQCGRPVAPNTELCQRHLGYQNTVPAQEKYFLKENEARDLYIDNRRFFGQVSSAFEELRAYYTKEDKVLETEIQVRQVRIDSLNIKNKAIIAAIAEKEKTQTGTSERTRQQKEKNELEINALREANVQINKDIEILKDQIEALKIRASDCDENKKNIYLLAQHNYNTLEETEKNALTEMVD